MRCQWERLPGTCGVNLYHYFGRPYAEIAVSSVPLGGADLACASFVNTPDCKQAYDALKVRFNVVYQSSVRINRNSGRPFFFVVYDGKRN